MSETTKKVDLISIYEKDSKASIFKGYLSK